MRLYLELWRFVRHHLRIDVRNEQTFRTEIYAVICLVEMESFIRSVHLGNGVFKTGDEIRYAYSWWDDESLK